MSQDFVENSTLLIYKVIFFLYRRKKCIRLRNPLIVFHVLYYNFWACKRIIIWKVNHEQNFVPLALLIIVAQKYLKVLWKTRFRGILHHHVLLVIILQNLLFTKKSRATGPLVMLLIWDLWKSYLFSISVMVSIIWKFLVLIDVIHGANGSRRRIVLGRGQLAWYVTCFWFV